ncbi:unnamed protein product [Brassica oleracea var. botrytis]
MLTLLFVSEPKLDACVLETHKVPDVQSKNTHWIFTRYLSDGNIEVHHVKDIQEFFFFLKQSDTSFYHLQRAVESSYLDAIYFYGITIPCRRKINVGNYTLIKLVGNKTVRPVLKDHYKLLHRIYVKKKLDCYMTTLQTTRATMLGAYFGSKIFYTINQTVIRKFKFDIKHLFDLHNIDALKYLCILAPKTLAIPALKLSVRKETTLFKKPSSSLYKARVATVLKKAFELSELCGVNVCIIWFDREGNLVKTCPENEEAKVRAMAERYSMLSEQERNKKSTSLSGFLNKKMMDDKKESLKKKDNKFSGKVSEFMDSLQSRFQTLQESLFLVDQQPKETSAVVSTDLSSNHPSTTTTSLSKFSILLYNHDNGDFTELANNSSGFEQPSSCNQGYGSNYLDLLLGEQQRMMMAS